MGISQSTKPDARARVCNVCPVSDSSLPAFATALAEQTKEDLKRRGRGAYLGELNLGDLRCPECPKAKSESARKLAGVVEDFLPEHKQSSASNDTSCSSHLGKHGRVDSPSGKRRAKHVSLPDGFEQELKKPSVEEALQSLGRGLRAGWQKLHPVT